MVLWHEDNQIDGDIFHAEKNVEQQQKTEKKRIEVSHINQPDIF